MEYTALQNNFSSGIIDPLLWRQVNSQVYATGVKRCINFIPDSRGYLFRRPGTRYADLSVLGNDCRVRTLRTPDGPLVIIFADRMIYIFSHNIKLLFTIASPYQEKDLPSLDIAEFESRLYIVHEDYPPHVLYSSSTTGFTQSMETVGLASYKTLSAYDKELLNSSTYISGQWFCEQIKFTGDVRFDKPRMYPSCQTFKGGRWYLSGCIQRPSTIYASRSPDVDGNYRFYDFTMSESFLISTEQRLVKTTIYESEGSSIIADVQYKADSNSVSIDYDPTIAVPEDKTTISSVMYKRDGSVTTLESERYKLVESTEVKTYRVKDNYLPDHAIELTESDTYGSRINWLFTQQRVLAGTQRAVWMDTGVMATPATFDMNRTVSVSSSEIQPVAYSNMIFFATSDKRNIKAIFFDSDSGGYRLVDASLTAKSLFTSNIVSMVVVEGKIDILWVLLEEGKLLSCTLSGNVFGWAEQQLGGQAEIKDIAVYHAEGDMDLLYLLVDRGHANEQMVPIIYLETFSIEDLVLTEHYRLLDGCIEGKASVGTNHVDLSNVNMHEFTEGDVLQMSTDNWFKPSFEYFPGSIEIDVPNATHIYVGFPIESSVEFLMQEIPAGNRQTSIGVKRKAVDAKLQVYRSAGGSFGFRTITNSFRVDNGKFLVRKEADMVGYEEFQRLVRMGMPVENVSPDLFTGMVPMPVSSFVSDEVTATVMVDVPLPLTIQALQVKYSLQEV